MSLTTAFPFHAYVGDLKTRDTVETKRTVSLSLLSSDDMERVAFVEVSVRCGMEDKVSPWRPVIRKGEEFATFYDTRMGNFDVRTFPTQACSTCAAMGGQAGRRGNERCAGHFGYISMPRCFPNDPKRRQDRLYVVNPHLSDEVQSLMQSQCFFCHHFRAPSFDVERYRLALLLIDCGLVGEALHFLDIIANAKGQEVRSKRKREPNESVINDLGTMYAHVERIVAKAFNIAVLGGEESVSAGSKSSSSNNSAKLYHWVRATSTTGSAGYPDFVSDAMVNRTRASVLDVRNDIAKQAVREMREYDQVCSHCNAISPRITSHNSHSFFFFNRKNMEFNVAYGKLSEQQVREWEANNKRHHRRHTYMTPMLMREHIKELCAHEDKFLTAVYPHLGEPVFAEELTVRTPMPSKRFYKVFFLDKILVPPLPLRLSSGVQVSDGGVIAPDQKTRSLSDVLGFVEQIEIYHNLKNMSTEEKNLVTDAQEEAYELNLRNLQAKVNEVYTAMLESFAKKEGLFRMHMMGKRVNQACRSVISPDYLLEPDELLLPRPFSRNLSFPETVAFYSPARMQFLKKCVINGPQRYPGATHLELRQTSGETKFVDLNVPEQSRRQHAEKYFALAQSGGTLIVHRHIVNGDRVVFNRQPTLHKVSMMGYRVRVLSGLKTIRFHYVNGKSYNADFDGDEMNVHVPQSMEARAELDCLMNANLQFLLPTSGKPIRGLIQDHVAAGVLLTLRDKFLDHDTFVQFFYVGISPYLGQQQQAYARGGSSILSARGLSQMIPIPAVLRPRPLWTGKQLISTLIRFVTSSFPGDTNTGLTLQGTSLIQPSAYTTTTSLRGKADQKSNVPMRSIGRDEMGDDRVLFLESELISGVIDKNQLGPSSMALTHVMHDIFGPHVVGQVFAALGRILTVSLQREGFSVGMDDVTLILEGRRKQLLRELDDCAMDIDADDEASQMKEIMQRATRIQKEFVPGRMLLPFPKNQLLMMTVSGAKGSNTNTIQMALGLGQQLFDGRRVKPMNSGKTLPGFFIGERRARSFGYAMGRFASGIRPPEYTIHAMAGRDGLIDTAVKTSRSGHLQRCLIKGLESLVVQWDHSVRDANGNVVQFIYGGDGLDTCKASTLTSWEMTKDNLHDMAHKYMVDLGGAADNEDGEDGGAAAAASEGRVSQDVVNANGKRLLANREGATTDAAAGSGKGTGAAAATPLFGCVAPLKETVKVLQGVMESAEAANPLPSHIQRSLDDYVRNKAQYVLFKKVGQVARWNAKGQTKSKLEEKRRTYADYYRDVMTDITARHRAGAFSDAGEPVGLLAAQAAGEPSTQMTLNTFHSAGSTVTHVTEGIPRLRELLIHASVQNAAVIVPVQGAKPVDEEVIAKVLRVAVPSHLTDCLAQLGDGGRGYTFHVRRPADSTVLDVSFVFSHALVSRSRDNMGMSHHEHLQAFMEALKLFARRVTQVVCGRSSAKEESGKAGTAAATIRRPVQDPMELADGAADFVDDEVEDRDEDDDVDDEAAGLRNAQRDAAAAAGGKAKKSRRGRSSRKDLRDGASEDDEDEDDEDDNEVEDDEDDGDDDDNNEEDMDDEDDDASTATGAVASRTVKKKKKLQQQQKLKNKKEGGSSEADEEEEMTLAEMAMSNPTAAAAATTTRSRDAEIAIPLRSQVTYTSFPPLRVQSASKGISVYIEPLPRVTAPPTPSTTAAAATDSSSAYLEALSEFFVIRVSITMPPMVVAVFPDVIDEALKRVTLPTWLPQFESVKFMRKSEDTTSGELVFQGPTATIHNVVSLLSLFTLRGNAIQTNKAKSTDIDDMAQAYGVESAYKSLYEELRVLFKRYDVDHRHLSLIADAATNRGEWENFNFTGVISHSSSPLFQMTFASSKRFLHTAVTRGVGDDLRSISSAIMVGERPRVGTTCASVFQQSSILKEVVERL